MFGLSIWFFFLVVSSFFLSLVSFGCFLVLFLVFGCFVRIQILDSEVRNVWVCVVLVGEAF